MSNNLNLINFNSIFFGGTGWNLLWSFGAAKKLYELGFRNHIRRVGCISAGCMSALAFLDAASFDIGIVQSEQLHKEKYFFSFEFRKRLRYYFEAFANQTVMDDIKKSGCEFYSCYVALNKFPDLELKLRKDFDNRDDLLTSLSAGCYIPFVFGIEPNMIAMPILNNGDFAVDAGIKGISTYRWDEKTLIVSPSQEMCANVIGGNLGTLQTIGIRSKKLTDKELFLKGYSDASRWYAEYFLHKFSWEKQNNWQKENLFTYKDFLKKFYK